MTNLEDVFVSHDGGPTGFSNNICDAVFAVARAINTLAEATQAVADANARIADEISLAGEAVGKELMGIGQEIGWGLDKNDTRQNHL